MYTLTHSTQSGSHPDRAALRRRHGRAALTAVCERMAAGEALQRICADPALPDLPALARALDRSAGLRRRFEAARRFQVELWIDEMRLIADGEDEEREDECPARDLQRDKLRIDTRKWLVDRVLAAAAGREREAAGPDDAKATVLVMKYGDEPEDPPAP
jgi:hypothetical protein